MSRSLLLLLAGALLAPGIASAANPAGMDLAASEARLRDRLMQLDTNHDGKLSAAEFAARPAPRNGRAVDPNRAFARMDLNHDGFIDGGEIHAEAQRRFARLDTNHDGTVSAAERAARRQAMPPR